MNSKRFFQLIISAMVVMTLCAMVYVLSPVLLMFHADEIISSEWENKYIDGDYEGWCETKIEGLGTVFFPNNWKIIEDGNEYRISNDGKIIGYGIYASGDYSSLEDLYSYVSSFLGFEPTAREIKRIEGSFSVEACSYYGYIFSNEDKQADVIIIDVILNFNDSFQFFFPADDMKSEYIDKEIAEAIVFSIIS